MSAAAPTLACLAPLQEVMLRDSLSAPDAGHHVEQVEIIFTEELAATTVAEAWRKTVTATEALRGTFDFVGQIPLGIRTIQDFPATDTRAMPPYSWASWLEADRCRPLLFADEVPWRTVHWPSARRLVWTFHHALLDGRSITRILRGFLSMLDGDAMQPLARSCWHPPSPDTVAIAARMFRGKFGAVVPTNFKESQSTPSPAAALHCAGRRVLKALQSRAARENSTVATLVTWAWGQAFTTVTGTRAALVEQIRAGAPQPGTAGFTMNLMPLLIHRHIAGPTDSALRGFREELLEMRQIEAVSFSDFGPGIYPDVNAPDTCTLMVEHATLRHLLGTQRLLESVSLHERRADTSLAAARLLPELELEVDGPQKHELLACWITVLQDLARDAG